MKCRYKNCLHPGEDVKIEDAIYYCRQYFHKDCFKEKAKDIESKKCKYPGCNYEPKNVTINNNVRVNNRYYHKDCYINLAKESDSNCTCAYDRCKDKNLSIDDAVLDGNKFYHQKCLDESKNIAEIIDVFHEKCNPNVVVKALRKIICELIDNGNPSDLILFGVKYYVNHKIPLNYPAGLRYVMQNKDVHREYNKEMSMKQAQEIKDKQKAVENTNFGVEFTYKPIQKKGLGDLFGD